MEPKLKAAISFCFSFLRIILVSVSKIVHFYENEIYPRCRYIATIQSIFLIFIELFDARRACLNKPRIILGIWSANERRRYIVTPSLIGWAHTQNNLR